MKLSKGNGLLTFNLLAVLLIATVFILPSGGLRIVLGLPFVLLFSGYTLIAAMFPGKDRLDGVTRLVLSACGSVTVAPLLALGLYYSGSGITLESVLTSLGAFCLVCSIIGWWRWRRLAAAERFYLKLRLPRLRPVLHSGNKIITVCLVPAILAAAVMLGYFTLCSGNTGVDVPFTELYLPGDGGQWGEYPGELKIGKPGELGVGITNREQRQVTYRIELILGESTVAETESISLSPDGRWQETIKFMPVVSGNGQLLKVLLYKDSETEPSAESLHLWVDITD
jgi:uncharacterized membrane protein